MGVYPKKRGKVCPTLGYSEVGHKGGKSTLNNFFSLHMAINMAIFVCTLFVREDSIANGIRVE